MVAFNPLKRRVLPGWILLFGLVILAPPAHAQNTICPTAAITDSSNKCASTAFVKNVFAGGIPLTQNDIFVGNASNLAIGVPLSGDCGITASGVITCVTLNAISPGTLFPLNAAPAGTLTGTTLASNVVNSSLTTAAGGTFGTFAYQNFATPPTIGGTTPGIGTFSTFRATGNAEFDGTITAASLSTVGAIAGSLCQTSGGLFLYEAGINCFAASAASVTVGTTTVASGTSPFCLNDNAGTLGNVSCALLTAASQVLSGGASVTSLSQAAGNITIDCSARPLQYQVNTAAFTITAPTTDGSCVLAVQNGPSAGAITFTGWSVGTSTGDAFATTLKHTQSCTATSASPAVFTDTSHGLPNNWPVYLTGTTAPTGFSLSTQYYTTSVATNTYQLSATPGGAAINSSSTGTSITCNADSVFFLQVERIAGLATYSWKALQ